ncbi:MAG: hypothetical protein JWP20_1686 [Roseomonas sp.]|jgi:hypothetical protein|nr:hypothetical protein [Roseomonas sp.]
MRVFLVCLSVLLALALWVWATGPGTTLPLAIGGWIFCAAAGRTAYVLLRPRAGDQDNAPPPAARPSAVIHPRQPHQH